MIVLFHVIKYIIYTKFITILFNLTELHMILDTIRTERSQTSDFVYFYEEFTFKQCIYHTSYPIS